MRNVSAQTAPLKQPRTLLSVHVVDSFPIARTAESCGSVQQALSNMLMHVG